MAAAVGRGFLVQPCPLSLVIKNILKPSFGIGHGKPTIARGFSRHVAQAQVRPTSHKMSQYPRGPLLNPLGLAKEIKNAHEWKLKRLRTVQIVQTLANSAS